MVRLSVPRSLVLRASAKVNLALEVLGKRSDGYHEIATVLQAVDLSDRLLLEEVAEGIEVWCDTPAVPTDHHNLAWRAADLLRRTSGVDRGVRIRIWKRIPVAAGLGGGSSDGAAVLYGLNRLWGLGLDGARLQALATELGMDVPFFLSGGRALATGRGECLRLLPPAPGFALVLVNPKLSLSTREVYARVPEGLRDDGARVKALIAALGRGPGAVAGALHNSLEAVAEELRPVLGELKATLKRAGALGCVMSGSGPTVVGVAASARQARVIGAALAASPWASWVVRTLPGRAVGAVRVAPEWADGRPGAPVPLEGGKAGY